MKYIFLLVLIMAVACQKQAIQTEITKQNSPKIINTTENIPQIASVKQQDSIQNQPQIEEFEPENFADKLKIGKRKLNRVEISTYRKDEKLFVKTKFYAKSKSQWILKNEEIGRAHV